VKKIMEFFGDSEEEEENVWVASSNGDIDKVKAILQSQKLDINIQDEYGYSPMYFRFVFIL
jgi:hypothetical protein